MGEVLILREAEVRTSLDMASCIDAVSDAFAAYSSGRAELTAVQGTGKVVELGEIVSGEAPGRIDDSQLTVCDRTRVSVQDVAAASLAVKSAVEAGLGESLVL